MEQQKGVRVAVQKFGRFLSGMVMPNIGAFIAWGLFTALFISTGWFPNETLVKLVDPTLKYLLPLLIGYTGGTMVHKQRGGVIGALMTMGVIIGSDIPMLLGAMICGPLGAWILKKFDDAIDGKIKSGFEMLVNNFSLGIIGGILTIISFLGIGPLIQQVTTWLSTGVEFLVSNNLIPLASILIEPAKILFLNNAINHGVLGPIGLNEAAEAGKSLLFLLESNPGPGLGILLAYMIVGRGSARSTAPGAVLIHAVGGIHEIYFPYVLMNPKLIIAAIAGGVSGTLTFSLLGAGLVATPSPGSIIALAALAPKGELFPVIAGVVVATVVSFLLSVVLLKTTKQNEEENELDVAAAKMKDMKAAGKTAFTDSVSNPNQVATEKAVNQVINNGESGVQKSTEDVHKIVFSCDAGMGSSAMGASILRKKMKAAGSEITVINTAISDIPDDADIVITHQTLTDRAKQKAPKAEHISIDNFLKSPEYELLVDRLTK